MPVGQRNTASSNGQTIAVHRTSSFTESRRKPGLHEIPMAEQHRVADRAEERGADEQAQPPRAGTGRRRTPRAASNPTVPSAGATRSSAGGNSAAGSLRRRGVGLRGRPSPRPGPCVRRAAPPARSRRRAGGSTETASDIPANATTPIAAASATVRAHGEPLAGEQRHARRPPSRRRRRGAASRTRGSPRAGAS